MSEKEKKPESQYQQRIDEVLKAHAEWENLKLSDRAFDKKLKEIYARKPK